MGLTRTGYAYTATRDAGVFRTTSVTTTVAGISRALPDVFMLFQNYPNPFNPSTTISYSLPKRANVSLKIFNMLGQLVATLVDEQKDAGYFQATWNATVSSGIYFYRLQAGGFVETKKMMFLK
jgi:hypothetical protein